MTKTALSLFLLIILLTPLQQGHAQGILSFRPPESSQETRITETVTKITGTNQEPYIVATVDLNGDSLDEYIVKPKNTDFCEQKKLCPYTIMAFQDFMPILIGKFDAHKIAISTKKTYGIQHIIVYNDLYNDYKTSTAIWNPSSFRFELQ
ncbi:MAG: hypothetical protein R3D88_01540 [Alphaproteobacteria bacterium]|nr:hypothetical protein [Alphaproteobacteria bacterium]